MRGIQPVTFAAIALACVAAGGLARPASQDPELDPALYKHVSHLGWVVRDLDAVVAYWEKLGLRNIRRAGVQEFPDVTFRGRTVPTKVKKAFVDIGDHHSVDRAGVGRQRLRRVPEASW